MLNVDDMPKFWFDKSNDSQSEPHDQELMAESEEQSNNQDNQYQYSVECKY